MWICMPARHCRWRRDTIRQRPQCSGNSSDIWSSQSRCLMEGRASWWPRNTARDEQLHCVYPLYTYNEEREALGREDNSKNLKINSFDLFHTCVCVCVCVSQFLFNQDNNIIRKIGYLVLWNIKQIPVFVIFICYHVCEWICLGLRREKLISVLILKGSDVKEINESPHLSISIPAH